MTTDPCSINRERLADYLASELTPDERRAFEDHLISCEPCRAHAESLGAVQRSLLAAAGSLDAANARTASLTPAPASLRIPAPQVSRVATRIARPLALAASLALAFAAGYFSRAPRATPLTPSTRNADATIPRVARDYLKAAQSTPTASSFTWSLLSVARR